MFPLRSFEDLMLFIARNIVVLPLNSLATMPESTLSSFLDIITMPRNAAKKSSPLISVAHCPLLTKPTIANASSRQPAMNLTAPFLCFVSTRLRITSLTCSFLMLLAGSHAEPTESRIANATAMAMCTTLIFSGG